MNLFEPLITTLGVPLSPLPLTLLHTDIYITEHFLYLVAVLLLYTTATNTVLQHYYYRYSTVEYYYHYYSTTTATTIIMIYTMELVFRNANYSTHHYTALLNTATTYSNNYTVHVLHTPTLAVKIN